MRSFIGRSSRTNRNTESCSVPNSSIKKRYAAKLLTNLTGAALGFVTMSFVPRAIGAADFGRFEFITVNLNLLITTLGLSVPVAFFNWVSKEDGVRRDAAIAVTALMSLGVVGVLAILIAGAQLADISGGLWPDIGPGVLWLGFLFAVFFFFIQNLGYLGDGIALSVGLETRRMVHNVARAGILTVLFFTGFLNLAVYFWVQISLLAGLSIWLWVWMRPQQRFSREWLAEPATKAAIRDFLRFAWGYSRPLVLYGVVGLMYGYADRWVLQISGGSEQQAFYGLAYRFGSITFMFTSAMTAVLMREFTVSHAKNDLPRLQSLFNRIRMFVGMAAVLGAFLAVNAGAVTMIFAGPGFEAAAMPVAIMAFYPIHQTFGQLSNSLILAAGKTRFYSRVGIATMILSIPISYLLLANGNGSQIPWLPAGLGLGATGLAIKMVGLQLIVCNIFLFYNTRQLRVAYRPWVWFQILAVGLPLIFAWVVQKVVEGFGLPLIPSLFVQGVFYVLVAGIFCLGFPGLIGVTKEELRVEGKKVLKMLSRS